MLPLETGTETYGGALESGEHCCLALHLAGSGQLAVSGTCEGRLYSPTVSIAQTKRYGFSAIVPRGNLARYFFRSALGYGES